MKTAHAERVASRVEEILAACENPGDDCIEWEFAMTGGLPTHEGKGVRWKVVERLREIGCQNHRVNRLEVKKNVFKITTSCGNKRCCNENHFIYELKKTGKPRKTNALKLDFLHKPWRESSRYR